jgi:hypothetical protein
MAHKNGAKPNSPKPDRCQELALGKFRFILQRGIVGWGLPTLIIYLLLHTGLMVFTGRSLSEALKELFPFNLAVALTVFALTGLIMGNLRWKKLNEEVLRKKTKTKQKKGGKK